MQDLLDALGRYAWLVLGIGLLVAVTFLPPDTSLSEVKRTGTLTACVPTERPPLVTGEPQRPGIEIELVRALAGEMGVAPAFNTIAAMGQDFDPSRWRITRAQCQLIGGGITDTPDTRAFLEVSPPYGESGWVVIARSASPTLAGGRAAVLATVQGVDRIALSRYLRDSNVSVSLMRSTAALIGAIQDGTADYALADALSARGPAERAGLTVSPMPPPFAAKPLVFGLWKGDLTLKRAIVAAFQRLRQSGRLEQLIGTYLDA